MALVGGGALARREQPGDVAGPAGGFTPMSSSSSNALSDLLNQLQNLQTGSYNPNLDFESQVAMLRAGGQMQERNLRTDYGFGQERLGLQQEQLGLQRSQLDRARGLAPQYQALDERGFGLSEQDINAANLGAWRGAESAQRGLTSSATARGSLQTHGTRQGFTDIQRSLQSQLEGIGRERGRLDIARERSKLGYQEQQAQLADQGKNLDLMGKQLGISGREAGSKLQQALEQIGLSERISIGDIARSVQSQLAGQYDPLSGITGRLIQMAFGG